MKYPIITKVRRFSKIDWYGYAGAERFLDGSEPFIFSIELESKDNKSAFCLTADKTGFLAEFTKDDWENEDLYSLEHKITSPKLVKKLMKVYSKCTPADLLQYGFQKLS